MRYMFVLLALAVLVSGCYSRTLTRNGDVIEEESGFMMSGQATYVDRPGTYYGHRRGIVVGSSVPPTYYYNAAHGRYYRSYYAQYKMRKRAEAARKRGYYRTPQRHVVRHRHHRGFGNRRVKVVRRRR